MKITRPTLRELLLSVAVATAFSAFIYLEHFGFTLRFLNTLFALGALYGLLGGTKKTVLLSGFWIGLLWFYWIGFSFQYYGFAWAMPLVALGFGAIYALYFGTMALTSNPFLRALILFALSFVWPMDFNWMQPELVFVESYLGYRKWEFALILFALAGSVFVSSWKKVLPLPLLIVAVHPTYSVPPQPDLKIKLVQTQIPQDFKWQIDRMDQTVQEDFDAIDSAIRDGYDIVVLPEAAFPLYMTDYPLLSEAIRERSEKITVVTGTLHEEKGKFYNVAYIYNAGKITVAKKTILVPFGEYIPLPKFMREWVNRTIFGGGSDFVTADKPTDFTVKGIRFRNAICYEATREELYSPEAKYMIAISNNGWFTPSVEPTLQNLLIRFYARQNGTVVFHATNSGGTGIVY